MTTPREASVALELAEIRRSVEVGFTEQRGQLALLVQRGDQTDKDLAALKSDVEALKRSRWPIASVGTLTGAAGLAIALWQAAAR